MNKNTITLLSVNLILLLLFNIASSYNMKIPSGVIAVFKPKGMYVSVIFISYFIVNLYFCCLQGISSFDVVYKIRKILENGRIKEKRLKIGHGGTLDPLAGI